jgi:hypothetical protein
MVSTLPAGGFEPMASDETTGICDPTAPAPTLAAVILRNRLRDRISITASNRLECHHFNRYCISKF